MHRHTHLPIHMHTSDSKADDGVCVPRRGDRYDGLRACIGQSMSLELHKLRVFMVSPVCLLLTDTYVLHGSQSLFSPFSPDTDTEQEFMVWSFCPPRWVVEPSAVRC